MTHIKTYQAWLDKAEVGSLHAQSLEAVIRYLSKGHQQLKTGVPHYIIRFRSKTASGSLIYYYQRTNIMDKLIAIVDKRGRIKWV